MKSRPSDQPRTDVGDTSLYDRLCAFDTLWAAWERVRANRGAAGGDGITTDSFARLAGKSLNRLAESLRDGSYAPGPSRRVLIPKKSGGLRPLDIPCVIDRVAQTAVAALLEPIFEPTFEPTSFAYRKGRSVAQAVARVASLRRSGYSWAVDADIERYFENVPHDPLLDEIETLITDTRLIELIAYWLEHHGPLGRGLPQGSPLSPLLANLYLDALDEAFEGGNVRIIRFADDFVLLCKSEAGARAALDRAATFLAGHGLVLNAEKTRVVPFDRSLRFLGHLFVRSMVLRESVFDDTPSEDALAEAAAAVEAEAPSGGGSTTDEPKHPPVGQYAPRLRPLYVMEPGRTLDAKGEHYHIRDGDTAVRELPWRRVDLITVSRLTEVSAAALDMAASAGTELVRVNGHGETLGRWSNPGPGHAGRQLAQARLVFDAAGADRLVREFVGARIHNQRALLRRLNYRLKDPPIEQAAVRLSIVYRKLRKPGLSVDQMRGIEGEAGAVFWVGYWAAAGPDWAWVGHRRRRGQASDPINLIINALCATLARDVRVALTRAGLHPGFGFLHAGRDDAEALVYDMMEPLRSPVVEALALALIGRRSLQPAWFNRHPGGGLSMDRAGWQALIRGYESWLDQEVVNPATGQRMLWRGVIADQAEALAAHVEGRGAYRAYRMDY